MNAQNYSHLFQRRYMWSVELQRPSVYQDILEQGFLWIRQDHSRSFDYYTRRPTVGCRVELYKVYHPDCVPIQSPKGQRLIQKLCYF